MDRAENTAQPRSGERVTVAAAGSAPAVAVCVVQGARQVTVDGWAHAWTPSTVFVAWKDSQGLQHRDWFPSNDVRSR